MHWILGITLTVLVFWGLKQWGAMSPEQRRRNGWKLVLIGFAGVLLVLVLTGRIHIITAAIAALLPLLKKLPSLLRYLPLLSRYQQQHQQQRGGDKGHREQAASSAAMTVREACEVLGVDEHCSREDVITAHRRLMQKLHPDRGGNDYLAAKVNEAKAVLLARHR